MSKLYDDLATALQSIRKYTSFAPEVALVLGSGLGSFVDEMRVECEINYSDIAGFPVSTVSGHAGKLVFGYVADTKVVAMQGRVHYYEGYAMSQVVMPIRLMKLLGANILFLTNAAGGINNRFNAGEFMIITGQISSFVPSPLIGENIDELGDRFPDMSQIYDKPLRTIIEQIALNESIDFHKGVYLQTTGPNYETPEEIKMYYRLGADAVGMSTAVEAIAGVHCGLKVCGVSCITNLAAGLGDKLSHDEVKITADKAHDQFVKLVYKSIVAMGSL